MTWWQHVFAWLLIASILLAGALALVLVALALEIALRAL
jgi:hypothetical protein